MPEIQKIQAQTYTSSLLRCPTQNYKKMSWAVWYRKNEDHKQEVKRQRPKIQSNCFYHCSIFDFDSHIILQLQDLSGIKNIYEYGPIKLDPKIEFLLKQSSNQYQFFPVTLCLGKNKKFVGKVSISQKQNKIFTLNFHIQKLNFSLQYRSPEKQNQYWNIFNFNAGNPLQLNIFLFQNKSPFKKQIQKLNIFSHHDNFISIEFCSEESLQVFIASLLYLSQSRIQTKLKKYNPASQQVLNQINNLFFSNDFVSPLGTPEVPQSVLQDFRNCILTPNSDHQYDNRKFAFSNFDKFLKIDNQSSQNKQLYNLGTHQTIGEEIQSLGESMGQKCKKVKSITSNRSQKNEQSQHSSRKQQETPTFKFKSHQSLKNVTKQHRRVLKLVLQKEQYMTKEVQQTAKYSYEQLLAISKYLQIQNKKLIQQNLMLKQKILQRDQIQKTRNYKLPQFLKNRNIKTSPQKKYNRNIVDSNFFQQNCYGARRTFDSQKSRSKQHSNRFATQSSSKQKMNLSYFKDERSLIKNKLAIYRSTHKIS